MVPVFDVLDDEAPPKDERLFAPARREGFPAAPAPIALPYLEYEVPPPNEDENEDEYISCSVNLDIVFDSFLVCIC